MQVGAGRPFAGAGVMYSGNPILFYVAGDYAFESRNVYPVAGLGVKF